ncbi:3-oxoacyl-[acyl-carrier-protein] synthase 2 [compost metagenome]
MPATRNLQRPDPLADGVDIVRGAARDMGIEHAISNGFGFGGVNASVLFKRWQGA